MKGFYYLISILYLIVLNTSAQVNINVDFSKWIDAPLSKTKIGLYQTPLVTDSWLKRDIPKLSELETRSMRYEIAWGKSDCYGYEMTTKDNAGNLVFDFSPIDLFCDLVKQQNSFLIMSHSYCPTVAGMAWKRVPTDYNIYRNVNKEFAKHWKDKKLENTYIEIWNEPDFDLFFLGNVNDYLNIYKYAAKGILEGNPDAKIGGPAGAFQGFFTPLLDKCKTDTLPLDFLSGHAYGDPTYQLNTMRNALKQANRGDVEMIMTEFAPYNTTNGDTYAGGKVERAEAAMTFFDALNTFLTYQDLTCVNWAQYIDPGVNGQTFQSGDKMGLIDANGGNRKALFNGFKIYGMMPVDRYSLTSDLGSIKGFASADPNNAGVVIWNTVDAPNTAIVQINNLPFQNGKAELYRIDTDHSWYETGNDSLNVIQSFDILQNTFMWSGSIPGKAVVFLKFTDNSGKSELNANKFAHVIRTNHWFFDRDMPAYSDFDFKTWITHLGMGASNYGDAVIGVLAEDIPTSFNVKFEFGDIQPKMVDINSTVNFRIDFQSKSGEYVKSTLFYGDIHDLNRQSIITWGTKAQPTQTVKVDISNFDVDLSQYAPSEWNGKAILTWQMQNTGRNSKAKIFIKSIQNTALNPVSLSQEPFRIYPNPCQSNIAVESIQDNINNMKEISILNTLGIPQKKIQINTTNASIDISDMPKGCYLLSIKLENKTYTRKIIKE